MALAKKGLISNIIKLLLITLCVFSASLLTSNVFAADFYTESDYTVSYTLSDSLVHVTYQIVETNTSDSHRILSRSINYPADVSNLSASKSGSTLNTTVTYDGSYSTITVNFNRLLFGSGSTINWTLSFDITGGVEISGLLRYFYVTGFEPDEQTRSYTVNVEVPDSYGQLNFISSRDYTSSDHTGYTRYTFESEEHGLSPASMIFGEFQAYDFSYSYFVDPTASLEFEIPSDRYNQRILFDNVEPPPASTTRDTDGNYIVKYTPDTLAGSNKIRISGISLVYQSNSEKLKVLMDDQSINLSDYLKTDEFWESDNPVIQGKATQLTSTLTTNTSKAEAIYTFVIDTLVYDKNVNLNTHERKGAAVSIVSPEGSVCQEYTDLFIALARASGVPAREVAGYAEDVRSNSSSLTLHSWVEFWDEENGWTMADPTWGDSSGGDYFGKVGSDHFVMLTRGTNSIEPAIVASFTRTPSSETGISIEAASVAPTITVGATAKAEQQNNLPSVQFTLTNTGNVALVLEKAEAIVSNSTFSTDSSETANTYVALPGSTIQGNIGILSLRLPSSVSSNVEISITASTLFEPAFESSDNIMMNNYWLILPILIAMISILVLALLVRSAVKWIRK